MRNVLRDRPTKIAFAEQDHAAETLLFDRAHTPLGVRIRVSCRLHRQRAVRHKPFVLPIPSIRCVAGRFG
jgi:hypothetical protein